ncbi:C4-dicarboxylate TRAP transporter substrate-binding protein [Orrella sp. JC864]|uniref:C4-dicarboxylate TRAP transporter substrate-binding protein n=1 Tax=Orrella sp. JC864 TaxID=3120298 RepID=UPI00300B1CBE
MKKTLIAIGTAAMLGMSLVPAAAMAQQKFNLRWAHYLPKGEFLEVEEEFARRVSERTDGAVKFSIAYSGALGGGNEVLQLVGRGGVDMAAIVPGYYPDQLRYWKASQIPLVFDTPRQAVEIMQDSVQKFPEFTQELDKLGVQFLFQQALGSYYLTGPGENCHTLAGVSGKKVRAFGSDIPKVLTAAGATPLTIPVVEIYEALQRGALDYSFLNLGNVVSNRVHEAGKHTCGPIMTMGGHLTVIGKRTWNRLPEDYRRIILEEAAAAQARYPDWLEQSDAKMIETIKASGASVRAFDAAELEKWKAQTPDLLQAWVQDMKRSGQEESAARIAERWRELGQ